MFSHYNRAFDSIEHICIWKKLKEIHAKAKYIKLVHLICKNNTTRVRLKGTRPSLEICRGVKYGEPASPYFFNSILESSFKKCMRISKT